MEIYVTMENPRERGASSKMWKRSTLGGTTEAAAMGTGGPGPRLLSHTPVLSGHACLLVAGLVGAGAPGHVVVKGLVRTDCPSGPGPGQLRLSPSQCHTQIQGWSLTLGPLPGIPTAGLERLPLSIRKDVPSKRWASRWHHTAHLGERGLCRYGQGRGRQDCGGRGWTAAGAYCVPCWAPE